MSKVDVDVVRHIFRYGPPKVLLVVDRVQYEGIKGHPWFSNGELVTPHGAFTVACMNPEAKVDVHKPRHGTIKTANPVTFDGNVRDGDIVKAVTTGHVYRVVNGEGELCGATGGGEPVVGSVALVIGPFND